ncbi:MAG: TolC family protein [Deltaproteobacteria bacterium]|nr:TolC family protein [Deltaproteobacteria bacterium]
MQNIKNNFIIYILNILLLIFFCSFKSAWCLEDPLNSEKNIPLYNTIDYDKECEALDFYGENKSLNIFSAVNLALCNNPETKAAFFEIKKNAADYGAVKSNYLPSASISMYHNRSKTEPSDIENRNTGAEVSYEWLLFDFGKRKANNDKAYFLLLYSAFRHNRAVENIIYSTIETYCNLFSSKKEIQAAVSSEKAYKTAYEIAEEKYQLGIVRKSELLQAKTDYAKSSLIRLKAENANADCLGRLLKLLNIKQGTKIDIEKPEIINGLLISDKKVAALIEKALNNSADIKSYEALKKSYQAAKRGALRAGFPSISLYGGVGIEDSARQSENIRNSNIGIKASFPLFTGFYNTYNHKKAEYAEKKVELEKEETENNAAYEAWSAYNNLKTAEKNYQVSKIMHESALENKNLTLGMYKEGQSSMLEVLKAIASYADAEKEAVMSEYNRIIAQALLLKSVGALDLEALKIFNRKKE